jgi:hypothetical protein
MASAEGPARPHGQSHHLPHVPESAWRSNPCRARTYYETDRHARRRPFSSWMKRLANLKSLHTDSSPNGVSQKRINIPVTPKGKKTGISKNNPYSLSSRVENHNGHLSFSTPLSSQRSRHSSLSQSKHSISISHESQIHSKTRAPTLGTTAETAISDTGHSGAGTSGTAAKTDGDRNSTFSSPAPSLRSVTTTLTTVQSVPAPLISNQSTGTNHTYSHTPNLSTSTNNYNYMNHFSAQPATAVPAHLVPHGHPTTYQSATANNVLTDDASILTLASSSKRRRRNSLDTNASIRALAPASMFGGSRESLPLSVLSGTYIYSADTASLRDNSSVLHQSRPALGTERASLISASGVTAPALTSERNSYISTNPNTKYGDAASVQSGLLHGRNDSLSGSIGPVYRETKEREKEREGGTMTAPTSLLVDSATGPLGQGMDGILEKENGEWVEAESANDEHLRE